MEPSDGPAPEIVDKVRQSFARQSLMQTFGARIDSIGAGRVILSAPIGSNALQQHGHGHAGLTFALGDSAAGYAALSLMPPEAEVMTVEMKINLMSPASGDRLIATGQVIRAGRRLTVVSAEVHAEAGGTLRQVALLQGTMIPI
jgi:uncharacterized protein (TIGR00369 family)